MTQVALERVSTDLASAVDRVEQDDEHVILERQGKPVAAVISLRDLQLLDKYIEELEDRIDREEIEKALAEPGENIPYEVIRKEMGLA